MHTPKLQQKVIKKKRCTATFDCSVREQSTGIYVDEEEWGSEGSIGKWGGGEWGTGHEATSIG